MRALLAVENNISEAEALGADAGTVAEARDRILRGAQAAIVKGDLAKAADDGQRAYDLISSEVNTAPACLVGRLL